MIEAAVSINLSTCPFRKVITTPEVILVDVDSDDYSLGQIMHMIQHYQQEHPEMDVFLDGDRRAIIGRTHQAFDSVER